MESALYGIYTRVVDVSQKSNEWAQRTSKISDRKTTSALIPYKALSMKYSLYIIPETWKKVPPSGVA